MTVTVKLNNTDNMKALKAKQATKLEIGKTYLVHVKIGQLVTAKLEYPDNLWSNCCGVLTLYKVSDMLAIYDYPTFSREHSKH